MDHIPTYKVDIEGNFSVYFTSQNKKFEFSSCTHELATPRHGIWNSATLVRVGDVATPHVAARSRLSELRESAVFML